MQRRFSLPVLLLALIVGFEVGISLLDRWVPQDVPIAHLFYVPIILAAWGFGYLGGAITAVISLVLFIIDNYVIATHAPLERLVPAAALTFLLFLGVGEAAAAFFAHQRQLAALGARLRRRVTELDALYNAARATAASDDTSAALQPILAAVREFGDFPGAGLITLAPDLAPREGQIELRDTAAEQRDAPAPLSVALGRHMAERREPLLLDTTSGGTLLPPPWQALLALPLLLGDEVVGILYAADIAPRRFGAEERRPLETLAQLATDLLARRRLRARGLDLAQSTERNRLAREIHDTLAQSLLTAVLHLEATRALLALDRGQAFDELQRAEATTREALAEVRRSVQGLRPVSLADHSLAEALRAEVNEFSGSTGIAATFAIEGDAPALDERAEDGLFGIVREALQNVRRHAVATKVSVLLSFTPVQVVLTIRDNGIGFAQASGERVGHFGLVGMRERARLLGGDLTVESAPDAGTTVVARIPRHTAVVTGKSDAIRVLLCDDHALVRQGVAATLVTDPALMLVGEMASGEEAVARAPDLRPDVVVLDLRLSGIDGVETTRQLLAAQPDLSVLLLTSFGDDPAILEALRAGARGCLLKDAPPTELIGALHAVARGESVLATPIADQLLARWSATVPPAVTEELSAREVEVLQLAAAGTSNKEIAHLLGISERTAKAHMSHIMQKLSADDRTAAVTIALRRGLIRL